ncbi:MAG: DUF11 domain-containing protein [Pirellulales bacterium]|nr:DUF11 domain-containing protein [Pirellulales bacterium]
MKRFVVRFSLLLAIVAAGVLGVTQAQRMFNVAEAKVTEAAGGEAPQVFDALREEEPTRLAANPFDDGTAAQPAEAVEGEFVAVDGQDMPASEAEQPAAFAPVADAQPLAAMPAAAAPVEPAEFTAPQTEVAESEPTLADTSEQAPLAVPQGRYAARQPTLEPAPGGELALEPTPQTEEPADAIPPAEEFDAVNEPTPAEEPAEDAFAADPQGAYGAATAPAAAVAATGRPGDTQLEGPQSPTITLHKIAPAEVQVGAPTKLQIVVRNTGTVAVEDVRLTDEVPEGTRLVQTHPRADQESTGGLVWALGNLSAGAEATVEVEVMPEREGELGSVARVSYTTSASVRTVATRPELAIDIDGPQEVMIDSQVTLTIKVTNTGTGAATGVVLVNNLPPGLRHPAGDALEYEVGSLKPGESKQMQLTLTAAQPGRIDNVVTAQGDGQLQAESTWSVDVVSPALKLALEGPSRRYLDKPAVYTVSVSNPGTAPAKQIELVTYLPKGLEFVEADNYGEFDPQTGAVHWLLEELPPHDAGQVTVTARPIEPGEHTLRATGTARQGLRDEAVQAVLVEGVAALQFEVVDVDDPIEVGGETTYEIHVVNQGSKAATNVRLVVDLPAELKPITAEGPVRNRVNGQQVVFEGLPQLAPKADTTFRVRANAIGEGDARIRVRVLSDDMQSPVTKEESTRVFSGE